MTVPVGDLVVRISADTGPLKAGIAEATGSVQNFGRVSRTEFRQERALDALVLGMGNITSGAQGAAQGVAQLANSMRILTLSQPELFALVSVIGLIAAGWAAVKKNTDDATDAANKYIGKQREVLQGMLRQVQIERAAMGPEAPSVLTTRTIVGPGGEIINRVESASGEDVATQNRRGQLALMEARLREALGLSTAKQADTIRELIRQERFELTTLGATADELKVMKAARDGASESALNELYRLKELREFKEADLRLNRTAVPEVYAPGSFLPGTATNFAETPAEAAARKIRAAFKDVVPDMQDFIYVGKDVAHAITGIGEAIAQSLQTGKLKDFFKGFLAVVGSAMKQFGEALVSFGTAQLALRSLNPFVAIAAGAALITIGSVLSAAEGNVAASATGGTSSAVATQVQGNMTVVFPSNSWDPSSPIVADWLVKVLQNATNRNVTVQRGG